MSGGTPCILIGGQAFTYPEGPTDEPFCGSNRREHGREGRAETGSQLQTHAGPVSLDLGWLPSHL